MTRWDATLTIPSCTSLACKLTCNLLLSKVR